MSTITPEEQSAALAEHLHALDKFKRQLCWDYPVEVGIEHQKKIAAAIDAIASAYRAQAVEMERLKEAVTHGIEERSSMQETFANDIEGERAFLRIKNATIAELQSQLAREKARAEELQLCLGATEAQVKSLEASVLDLQQQLAQAQAEVARLKSHDAAAEVIVDDLRARYERLEKALRRVLPHVREYNEELGGCDHSVGVCYCGLRWDIERAEAALTTPPEPSDSGKPTSQGERKEGVSK